MSCWLWKKLVSGFIPAGRASSAYRVPYARYREAGCRAVVFDIDNTLVRHGEPATWQAVELFAHLRSIGLAPFLLSNNGEERVKSFAETVGADYIWKAGKPGRRGYRLACERLGVEPSEALAVGDQVFTDIWGAKRSGLRTVLVRPIDPREEIQIRFKRILERLVLGCT